MAFAPGAYGLHSTFLIDAWNWDEGLGHEIEEIAGGAYAPTGNAWPNANTAILVPLSIAEPSIITKLYWGNGATISTPGNVDVGLRDTAGNLLTSAGTQTPSGTNQIQSVDITDYLIQRGTYYVGMSCATANVANYTPGGPIPAANLCAGIGLLEITSAAPPFSTSANPATFAITTRAFIPSCGIMVTRALGP